MLDFGEENKPEEKNIARTDKFGVKPPRCARQDRPVVGREQGKIERVVRSSVVSRRRRTTRS